MSQMSQWPTATVGRPLTQDMNFVTAFTYPAGYQEQCFYPGSLGQIVAADVSQKPLKPPWTLPAMATPSNAKIINRAFAFLICKGSRRSHPILRAAFRAATGQGISDAMMPPQLLWPTPLNPAINDVSGTDVTKRSGCKQS